MIAIESLQESDKDRRVRYTSDGGDTVEEGTVKSWNEEWVFVRYDKRIKPEAPKAAGIRQPHSNTPKNSPGIATDPANLEFV